MKESKERITKKRRSGINGKSLLGIVLALSMVISSLSVGKLTTYATGVHEEGDDHDWNTETGACTVCDYECVHEEQEGDTCEICGMSLSSEEEELNEETEETEVTEASEESSEAFDATAVVDGVEIHVQAPEGVFPKGAELSVQKVTRRQTIENIEEVVEEEREADAQVAESYVFDIKVLYEGEEVEPDTGKGNVEVSFQLLGKTIAEDIQTDVYHVKGDDEDLTAEKLDAEASEESEGTVITVETDSFSYYVVEFTYNSLQYVLEGDTTVKLTDILSEVGIGAGKTDADISAVTVSDDSLFKAEKSGSVWKVTALMAFTTTEWMKVTIDGVTYTIEVTDTAESGNPLTFTAQQAGSTVKFQWASGSNVKYSTDGTSWNDYTAGETITLSTVGNHVSFKGDNVKTYVDGSTAKYFSMTGKIAASGDVTSLTNGSGGDVDLSGGE